MNEEQYKVSFQRSAFDKVVADDLDMDGIDQAYESPSDFATVSFDNLTQDPARLSPSSTDTHSSSNVLIMDRPPEESSPLQETHSDPFLMPRWLRHRDGLCMIVTSMIVFSISITIALVVQIYVGAPQLTPHGGIVSSDEFCSQKGMEFLKSEEASTVDATIFTALCIAVTHPHAASIGGGGFAMVHNQKVVHRATEVFDFREASSKIFANQSHVAAHFEGKSSNEIPSGVSIAVPGFLQGLESLHHAHGKTTWKSIVGQVADLARNGIPVSDELADAIEALDLSTVSASLKALLVKPDNITKLKLGDLLKQPLLADTLGIVADFGAKALYSGMLTQYFVSAVTDNGGMLTVDDMNTYSVVKSYNVNETKYSDKKIVTAGPPSFGFALHSVMSTMQQYGEPGKTESEKFLQIHRLTEALKYSFALQTQLGDPIRLNLTYPLFYNSNKSIGGEIKVKINDSSSYPINHYLTQFQPLQLKSVAQQQVSAICDDGFAVVITFGLGSSFGSKNMALGFVLNDAMLDFSWNGKNKNDKTGLNPSQANYIAGGVRPMSSLVPVIAIPSVTKCGVYILPGASPGYVSVSSLAEVLMNKNDVDLGDSIAKPRVHQQLIPNAVKIETSAPDGLAAFLENKGHSVVRNQTIGVVDAVKWLENMVKVYVDHKRDGPDNKGYSF